MTTVAVTDSRSVYSNLNLEETSFEGGSRHRAPPGSSSFRESMASFVSAVQQRPFSYKGRCCWGYMSRFWFIVMILLITTAVLCAILIPIAFYVIGPELSEKFFNEAYITRKNLRINEWLWTEGKVDDELFMKWGGLVAALTGNQSYNSHEVYDTVSLNVLLLEIMKQPPSMLSILNMLMPLMFKTPLNSVFRDWVKMGDCAYYFPDSMFILEDAYIADLVKLANGDLLPATFNFYFHGEKFAEASVPITNVDHRNDEGNVVVYDEPVNFRITNRKVWLQANLQLLPFAPLTKESIEWQQAGSFAINMHLLGSPVTYSINLDSTATMMEAVFNAGPFSKKNPLLNDLVIEDPYGLLLCLVADNVPDMLGGMLQPSGRSSNASDKLQSLYALARAGVEVKACLDEVQGKIKNNAVGEDGELVITEQQKTAALRCVMGGMLGAAATNMPQFNTGSLETKNGRDYKPTGLAAASLGGQRYDSASIATIGKVIGFDFGTDIIPKRSNKIKDNTELFLGATETIQHNVPDEAPKVSEYIECTLGPDSSCSFEDMTRDQLKSQNKRGYLIMTGNQTGFETGCYSGAPYGFIVYPGTAQRDKVLFYMQGGGACWDSILADLSVYMKLMGIDNTFSTCTTNLVPEQAGILDHRNPENPFNEWTIILLLYCSGDVHGGNKYRPKVPGMMGMIEIENGRTVRGFNNTRATLSWISQQKDISNPKKLFLGGCSAGTLALQLWMPKLVESFNMKGEDVIALCDSYIGSFPRFGTDVRQENTFQTIFLEKSGLTANGKGECVNTSTVTKSIPLHTGAMSRCIERDWQVCPLGPYFGFTEQVQQACENNEFVPEDLFRTQLESSGARIAFIQSKADMVQRMFNVMLEATGGADAGFEIKNTKDSKTFKNDESSVEKWCEAKNKTHCHALVGCSEVDEAYQGGFDKDKLLLSLWPTDISTTEQSESDLIPFSPLITMITRLASSSTGFRPGLERLIARLLNGVSYQMMGEDVLGGGNFWNDAMAIFQSYKFPYSWYIAGKSQHCFTNFDIVYTEEIGGVRMIDWIKNLIDGGHSYNLCEETDLPCM